MMVSSGGRFPCRVLNYSLMSSWLIISSAWEACVGRVVDRSCGAGGHAPPSCSQFRWLITVVTVVLLALATPTPVHSQSSSENRTQLDTEIYQQAFSTLRQLPRMRTGVIYNVSLPSNTTTFQNVDSVQVLRLRTHSLRIRGYKYNEINLPTGVTVGQNLRSVILVYRRFSQYQFYNASAGNSFVSPVVGILAYDAADISNTTTTRSGLTVTATQSPIQVQLDSTRNSLDNLKCAMYNNTGPAPQNGTLAGFLKNFTSSTNSCSWTTLGDYSLVGPKPKGKSNTWKIALGAALGGVALALLLLGTGLLCLRYRNRARFARMEHKADEGETLQDAKVGSSRAPAAGGTRTKGKLEKSLS